jgi:hypothetical protein
MTRPHREQEGYVYIRVRKIFGQALSYAGLGPFTVRVDDHQTGKTYVMCDNWPMFNYKDDQPYQRVISSRRVEEAIDATACLELAHDLGLLLIHTRQGEWVAVDARGDGINLTNHHDGYMAHTVRGAIELALARMGEGE